jgi:glycine cleavage system aminomethyltransferase T
VQRNIAYAYVDPDAAEVGNELKLGILGEKYAAVVVKPILYDPENHLVRT